MSVMRTQLSLQFNDKELYDNFIVPAKNERTLNSLIIKLLTQYYYSDEVRKIVEGTSLDDASPGVEIQSTQSICDGIRASLLVQDYLATELQQTIDNGTEDVSDILNRTNDLATESGLAKTSESDSGAKLLSVDSGIQQIRSDGEKASSTGQGLDTNAVLSVLLKAVASLAESSGNTEVSEILASSFGTPMQEESKEEPKNESLNQPIEVSTDVPTQEEIPVEETYETVDESNDFEDNYTPVAPVPPVAEDASDSMQELLGSLGL